MLNKEELKDISRATRLKLHQQEKHYIQTIVLNSIYSSLSNELVFKGGTALFFCFGLNRFSEDLDFTMQKEINIEKLKERIKKDLELWGIKNKISEVKENKISVSFKIGAEGPLYSKEIERCFVNIEISKREEVENFEVKEIKTIYPDIFPFTICIMKKEEVLAEKIRTILTRNYVRDLYDFYFLIKQNTRVDFELVNKKLFYYNKKFDKHEFLKKIDEMEEIWESELKPFIIGNFPQFLEVKKTIKNIF